MENLSKREIEKQMKEDKIINAAERIFCKKGFEDAFMEEIAREAEFTKRTVYQYFPNKEELYFAVIFRGFKKLDIYLKECSKNEETGLGKLEGCFKGFYKFYSDYPEILRLIGYLGYVKKRSDEDSKGRKEVMQLNYEIFSGVGKLIQEGKEDGSISLDFDAKKSACSLIFLMTSFFNQLSVNGDTFTEAFSLDIKDFSFFTIDLLLKGIK
jgi:AcrR family transcriptional regulator